MICFFPDYFLAVMQLITDELIPRHLLPEVIRVFHNRYGHEVDAMLAAARACDVLPDELPNWLAQRPREESVAASVVTTELADGGEEEILAAVKTWCESLHRSKLKRKGKLDQDKSEDVAD